MKTSLAARHSFRISPSASCTCFPGLPFRTSNSRLMRSSITASSCSLRPSRFRTCLASAYVPTSSTTRPKHASHHTCVSSTSTFPFHTLFFLPFHETLSVRHVVSPVVRSPSFLDRRLRPSLRFFVRVTHHLSRPRHERRGRADDTNATRGRRGPRRHTHSQALTPTCPWLTHHTLSPSGPAEGADTPLLARCLALPSRYTPFPSLSGRRRFSRETKRDGRDRAQPIPALFFHVCDAWLQVNRMQSFLDQGHAGGWNVNSQLT